MQKMKILSIIVCTAIIVSVILTGCGTAAPPSGRISGLENEIFAIPDPVLKSAIQENLNIYDRDIQAEDMINLTKLEINDTDGQITDLTGLEYCSTLEELDLSGNHIKDLSPLANLTRLETLVLTDNQISDLSALAGLSKLKYVCLNLNRISDISPLKDLTQMSSLLLDDNRIKDISALINLKKMTILGLSHNRITDVSSLRNLSNLEILNVGENSISDISPLVRAKSEADSPVIRSLMLYDNPLSQESKELCTYALEDYWINVGY
jgi:Leucine-rich repeat (LRR) protein